MIATFMPKPFSNRTGSGAHFHVSWVRRAENAFHDPATKSGMGLVHHGVQFLAGVLTHARASAPCGADGEFVQAPGGRAIALGVHVGAAYIAYADNNRPRACGFRTAASRCGCRFRLQPVSGSAH